MSLESSLDRREPVSYVVLVKCDISKTLSIKSLNNPKLKGGIYIYLGSANLSNPMKRVLRHFKKVKRLRWHIDYLTSSCNTLASVLVKGLTEADIYSILLNLSNKELGTVDLLIRPSIRGFGASDSVGHETHLFKVEGNQDLYAIVSQLLKIFIEIESVSKVDIVFS